MVDLFTHVLLAYALGTALSVRYVWVTPRLVTVAMMGALIPDLSRGSLLVPDETVTATFGVPFDWFGFHTVGGALVANLVGVILVRPTQRRRVLLLLLLGGGSHLFLDALLLKPSGYAAPIPWPLANQGPPTPRLYHSTDCWPAVVAAVSAAVTWYGRYRVQPAEE